MYLYNRTPLQRRGGQPGAKRVAVTGGIPTDPNGEAANRGPTGHHGPRSCTPI